ncbi:MAG: hypothetical protein IJR36_02035, partial [Lachnospiraceae bacterium]|nr:hypothetical protein [Lachnospiraceae bacterium]
MKKFFYTMLIAALVLCAAGCAKKDKSGAYKLSKSGEAILTDVTSRTPVASEDNARVFYEIFVGSFSDSDGDGIGDLRGIINRMDYLNDGD